jgi:hypothetical protein
MMVGWVYAFETPCMPGIVKIGATVRDPAERLRKANAGDTGPPQAYRIAWAAKVEDPFLVKRRIHAAFTERRINPRRDFFRATAEDAPVARQLAIDPSSWRL